jgi:DNA primase
MLGGTHLFLPTINQGSYVRQSANHRPWVNFKELRARLQFADVLRFYKVEIRQKEKQHTGPCPLPAHEGSRHASSFSANLERGIFNCFGCGAKGNVLEFAGLMAGIDLENGDALRDVAVKLQREFFPEGASTRTSRKPGEREQRELPGIETLVNPPLDFELKDLDARHPYFASAQLKPATVSKFGLGFCSRGLLQGRVAVPISDKGGKRIGYAGVAVQKTTPGTAHIIFPTDRERKGTRVLFRRDLLLYNAHQVGERNEDLVLVETFASVWWLHQCGFALSVATMGPECSEEQAQLAVSLINPSGRLWVMSNGNEAGKRFAASAMVGLSPHRFVRWMKLNGDNEPADLPAGEINRCFTS